MTARGERTRGRLIEAARELLLTTDYDALRVADICRQAGVSYGTFYVYFENRKTIALIVLTEFIEQSFDEIFSAPRQADAFASILEANLLYVRRYRRYAGLRRCLLQMTHTVPEAADLMQRINREFTLRLAADIRRRTAAELDQGRLDFVIHSLGSMIEEMLYKAYVLSDPLLASLARSPKRMAEHLSVLWYRTLYGCNPDPAQVGSAAPLLRLALAPSDG